MEFEKAKETAIRYIGISKKTEFEVRNKLKGKEISPLVIDSVISYLIELEYINDFEYTNAYYRTNLKSLKYFMYEIKQKLLQKGIDASIIEECEQHFLNENSNYNELVKEKLLQGKLKNYDEEKIYSYLYRRGFLR